MYKYCIVGILVATVLAACTPEQISAPSPTQNAITDARAGLPIFPGAIENESDIASYRYTVENADIDTVQRFYKDEMQAAGWELLGSGDMSGADIGKAYALWFVKDQAIISVDVFAKENIIQVMITLGN
jgi:hypothetical protein